jgi:flavin reductase (DIM6/NTAB) family NADH-FMN oxidoreductase RutF
MAYKSIDPKTLKIPELHGLLLGSIAPRPIAFASTIDKAGNVNLSPFSFFNVFGSNPPTLIFSPARRGRDNTVKHSYENVKEVAEVVINIANYPMVEQMSLSSTEYPKGVNEFVKAGFTEAASEKVRPPRVAEAPVAFECIVKEIIETGPNGGAGNLIICEAILDEQGKIDPFKLDPIGRLGANWYSRSRNALFEVEKPLAKMGIGVDALPEVIRNSSVLTGNDLGKLGNVEEAPAPDDTELKADAQWQKLKNQPDQEVYHVYAHELLVANEVAKAWQVLLSIA